MTLQPMVTVGADNDIVEAYFGDSKAHAARLRQDVSIAFENKQTNLAFLLTAKTLFMGYLG